MIRVLVFPSCNEPGLEIIHSLLKSNKIEVLGGSSQDHAFDPSRLMLRHFLGLPNLHDADFASSFRRILAEYSIDLVFPTVDALVAEFSQWQVDKTRFVTPGPECAHLVLSKAKTYAHLYGKVPVPDVFEGEIETFPVYAKPDIGSGSRGALRVDTPEELDVARRRGLLVTEYLPGEEYTVDCISDLEGHLLVANPRLRGRIGRGIALGARSVEAPQIEDWLRSASEELKITGPWFAQFKRDRDGNFKLLEINTRVAGSMGLTRYAGINIPLMSVFMYMGYHVAPPRLQPSVLVNRALCNWVEAPPYHTVIWDLDDTLIRKDGKADPVLVAHLFDCHNRGISQMMLSKNPDIEGTLARLQIPRFFTDIRKADDKLAELKKMIADHGLDLDGCLLVNDSYSEMLSFQMEMPGIRIVTPADIERLGWERMV